MKSIKSVLAILTVLFASSMAYSQQLSTPAKQWFKIRCNFEGRYFESVLSKDFDRSQISFHKLQRRGSAVKTSFSQNRGYDVYTYIFGDETPYANSTKVEIKFQEGQANGFGKIKGNATFGEIYKSNDCVRLSNPF